MITYLVIEVADERTTVLKAYNSLDKAILFAEDLAKDSGLIRDAYVNYEYVWACDDAYPVIYIETMEIE